MLSMLLIETSGESSTAAPLWRDPPSGRIIPSHGEGMTQPLDILQGTLDTLVLKTLSWGPQHGHAVARWIRDTTDGALEILDGALYASLHRMEARGLVTAEWGLSDRGKRAKFYAITAAGRRHLSAETTGWDRYVAVVSRVLHTSEGPA